MRMNILVSGAISVTLLVSPLYSLAQTARSEEVNELRQMVRDLSARVTALEAAERNHTTSVSAPPAVAVPSPAVPSSGPTAESTREREAIRTGANTFAAETTPTATTVPQAIPPAASSDKPAAIPATLPGGATLNYYFDSYYGYDFNHPIGRVPYLRAYDVLSNAFSINQAGLVLALDPNVSEGRRYGARLDLQFGQATSTLQGNPANEARPDIYRNIFQAYGTYVFPVGKGLTVDVGKWGSSIGIEGNYTKDQVNYSRSLFFDFLPFYHTGVRTVYKASDKVAFNYWIVNGTQQAEPTNSFKDQLFGLTLQPKSNLSWTFNYYVGQDHPDTMHVDNCTVPLQPGLCQTPITSAPDGKLHIFDSYATWNATPKLAFSLEGDYVISRLWANAAPGKSSAPSHVAGGAAYARYQWTNHSALAARTEYLTDRGGLFSGTTQALKEFTGTYEYKVAEGLLTRLEYRRDWSNTPFFLTNKPNVLSPHQDTFTVGMVWWYGGKQGAW